METGCDSKPTKNSTYATLCARWDDLPDRLASAPPIKRIGDVVTRRMLINAQRPEEVRIAIVIGQHPRPLRGVGHRLGSSTAAISTAASSPTSNHRSTPHLSTSAPSKDGLLRADDVVPSAYHKKAGRRRQTPPRRSDPRTRPSRSWSRSFATASATKGPSSPPTSASPAATSS